MDSTPFFKPPTSSIEFLKSLFVSPNLKTNLKIRVSKVTIIPEEIIVKTIGLEKNLYQSICCTVANVVTNIFKIQKHSEGWLVDYTTKSI